jgi:hypothetical protein
MIEQIPPKWNDLAPGARKNSGYFRIFGRLLADMGASTLRKGRIFAPFRTTQFARAIVISS